MTSDRASLRTVADYQFGAGAGASLFPSDEDLRVSRSRSGRPRQIHAGEERIATVGRDGRLTLGIAGGRRLVAAFAAPRARVVVGDESAPHVRAGRNVFAKFVRGGDPAVRARDEVAVVHEGGDLLGVGRAELDAGSMADFDTGMAVRVREGLGDED